MHIDSVYIAISRFFDTWVRLMENHTRRMQVRDSNLGNATILIVSPPTDPGIATLTKANRRGKSCLLCFSHQVEGIALDYCRRHRIENVSTVVTLFFHIPFGGEQLDAVYANCLFHLCDPEEIGTVLAEMGRALRHGGYLYSVHMGVPSRSAGRAWAWCFRKFPTLTHGFRPVHVASSLRDRGFAVVQDCAPGRLGFPLRYLVAQKAERGACGVPAAGP